MLDNREFMWVTKMYEITYASYPDWDMKRTYARYDKKCDDSLNMWINDYLLCDTLITTSCTKVSKVSYISVQLLSLKPSSRKSSDARSSVPF